jgi:hypothetical protein
VEREAGWGHSGLRENRGSGSHHQGHGVASGHIVASHPGSMRMGRWWPQFQWLTSPWVCSSPLGSITDGPEGRWEVGWDTTTVMGPTGQRTDGWLQPLATTTSCLSRVGAVTGSGVEGCDVKVMVSGGPAKADAVSPGPLAPAEALACALRVEAMAQQHGLVMTTAS